MRQVIVTASLFVILLWWWQPEQERDTEVQAAPDQVDYVFVSKSEVVPGNIVGSNFYATGSVWGNLGQVGGMHWGTDYMAPQGTPVRAPLDLFGCIVGTNNSYGTYGDWVQCELGDGHVIYFGHLQNVRVSGDVVAGTILAETNDLNHTHVQFSPPGDTGYCANKGTCLDFEVYYGRH